MTAHTPGPWAQGRVLKTTRGESRLRSGEAEERRRVFANFTELDGGRGRRLVAICENEEDARFVAVAPTMLAALEAIVGAYGNEHATRDAPIVKDARAAIAKAKGESA